MKFGTLKFDAGHEIRKPTPREKLDELERCQQTAITVCQARYVECERLETHEERMSCIDNANRELFASEEECKKAFRGE